MLALDYDGTLARDGLVDDQTLAALTTARRSGIRLVLVTGRQLTSLFNTFNGVALFERVVAENGAVLYDPATAELQQLAPAPPPQLLEALRQQAVPISVGHSVVATVEPHEHAVLETIRRLGIEWHVIFNKGDVMVLPASVTKATGLHAALETMGVGAEQTVGVGDAENDHAFLQSCGLSVAVSNALPALREGADWVTAGACGAGVREVVDAWLSGALREVRSRRQRSRGSRPD